MKKTIYLYLFLGMVYVLNGCSLDLPPEDEVSDPHAITSVVTAGRSLAAAYNSYKPYNDALIWVTRSDDMVPTQYLSRDVSLSNTYAWEERELINHSEDIWKSLYATLAQCNVLLERIGNVTPLSAAESRELKQIQQRATYLKALCYFDLLRIFSPAFGTSDTSAYGILVKNSFDLTQNQNRLSQRESVDIINRLLTIQAVEDTNTYYITPETAKLLQAQLALWIGDNSKAISLGLPLYAKYRTIIASQSVGTIWSNNVSSLRFFALDTKNITASPYIGLEYNTDLGDYLSVAPEITYTNLDRRADVYRLSTVDSNIFLLGKYRKQVKEREQMQYYTVARASELVFLLSAAYLKQGEKDRALALLNELLVVRGAPPIVTTETNREALLTLLLNEKQKEFVGEPIRFFDLKRNHRSITRTLSSGGTLIIPATDHRWTLPIPASEKRYNPSILQNVGWNVGEGFKQ